MEFGYRLRELREQAGLSLRQLGERAHFSRGYLWELEAGKKRPTRETVSRLDAALAAGGRLAASFVALPTPPDMVAPAPADDVETLRQRVSDTVSTSGISATAAEEWEQTALAYGRATRCREPGALLGELTADFSELCAQLQRRQSASMLRRLTRVAAEMSGLMFLTLIKQNERNAARSWARTARIAAREAGDPALQSWVHAQEAFVHYYAGQYREALAVARYAQDLVHGTPCVGAALAAALEARAFGKVHQPHDAQVAIGAAEAILSRLDAESVVASAFGYNEAQLRFHEGNALTHLGDTERAWRAQRRALDLYPGSDYLDRALVRLDRAGCVAHDGDPTSALAYATEALTSCTEDERRGLLTARAQEIFQELPRTVRTVPAGREFRDLLMITSRPEGADS
jgi:transcriptional regulator with XRE-family HTH domain